MQELEVTKESAGTGFCFVRKVLCQNTTRARGYQRCGKPLSKLSVLDEDCGLLLSNRGIFTFPWTACKRNPACDRNRLQDLSCCPALPRDSSVQSLPPRLRLSSWSGGLLVCWLPSCFAWLDACLPAPVVNAYWRLGPWSKKTLAELSVIQLRYFSRVGDTVKENNNPGLTF